MMAVLCEVQWSQVSRDARMSCYVIRTRCLISLSTWSNVFFQQLIPAIARSVLGWSDLPVLRGQPRFLSCVFRVPTKACRHAEMANHYEMSRCQRKKIILQACHITRPRLAADFSKSCRAYDSQVCLRRTNRGKIRLKSCSLNQPQLPLIGLTQTK